MTIRLLPLLLALIAQLFFTVTAQATIPNTHALVGGVFAELKGGDFSSGAIATAAGHVVGEHLKEQALADFDPAHPPFDLNDPQAMQAYADKLDTQIKAVSKAVGAAAAIITNNNISDHDLAIAAVLSESVTENNVLCGGLCVAGAIAAISSAYTAWVGDGDFLKGLGILGKGDDPVSQQLAKGTAQAVQMSYEQFPEATEATLNVLSATGDAIDSTVTYLDDKTGKTISSQWHRLDEDTRLQLMGAGKIVSVSLSALSVSKLTAIKNNAKLKSITSKAKAVTQKNHSSTGAMAGGVDGTKGLAGVPGRVQSRINVSNEGWVHVLKRHFSGKPNASQFSVSQNELKSLLQSKQVVGSPVTRTVESADGLRYVREIDMGRTIGTDAMNGNAATSVMTTMSDKYGNLITAFPGVLK